MVSRKQHVSSNKTFAYLKFKYLELTHVKTGRSPNLRVIVHSLLSTDPKLNPYCSASWQPAPARAATHTCPPRRLLIPVIQTIHCRADTARVFGMTILILSLIPEVLRVQVLIGSSHFRYGLQQKQRFGARVFQFHLEAVTLQEW